MLLKSSGRSGLLFLLAQWYWDSYQFSWRVRHHHLLKNWTLRASQCVNGCEDPVQVRQEIRSFSTFSTSDSYIALYCAMKDNPAFKPLQGNPTFFLVRASQYPLYWGSKLRVRLTYVLLREGYSWGVVEGWLTSSIESWKSTLFLRW